VDAAVRIGTKESPSPDGLDGLPNGKVDREHGAAVLGANWLYLGT